MRVWKCEDVRVWEGWGEGDYYIYTCTKRVRFIGAGKHVLKSVTRSCHVHCN